MVMFKKEINNAIKIFNNAKYLMSQNEFDNARDEIQNCLGKFQDIRTIIQNRHSNDIIVTDDYYETYNFVWDFIKDCCKLLDECMQALSEKEL